SPTPPGPEKNSRAPWMVSFAQPPRGREQTHLLESFGEECSHAGVAHRRKNVEEEGNRIRPGKTSPERHLTTSFGEQPNELQNYIRQERERQAHFSKKMIAR